MLSHLRFHRRAPSNPTSPGPDQQQAQAQQQQQASSTAHWNPPSSHSQQLSPPQDGLAAFDARPQSSNSSSLPPTLPPIKRVTSVELDPSTAADVQQQPRPQPQREAPRPPPTRSPYDQSTGFIGGRALQNYRRGVQPPSSESRSPEPTSSAAGAGAGASTSSGLEGHHHQFQQQQQPYHRSQAGSLPMNTNPPSRPPPQPVKSDNNNNKPASSFVAPTELQHSNANMNMTGRRPAGTRLATDSATMAPTQPPDPPKGKKGLPFLKNPMSTLLMRRKQNQNAPDLLPLPIHNHPEVPAYDPRIRGTRVHDFSAPRPRRNVQTADAAHTARTAGPDAPPIPDKSSRRRRPSEAHQQTGLASAPAPAPAPNPQEGTANKPVFDRYPSRNTSRESKKPPDWVAPSAQRNSNSRFEQQHPPEPEQPPPAVPPKDDMTSSVRSRTSQASSVASRAISNRGTPPRTTPSTRTNMSGKMSISEGNHRDILSSVPKHMKSTSSRFSFDMIGAAKQEKLLEERHRQKEAERKTVEPVSSMHRDSRFDDLDDFDYDAMMDDDGLEEPIPGVNADYDDYEEEIPGVNAEFEEEPIPGVNADYDEEPIPGVNADYDDTIPEMDDDYAGEMDPDNDQENFAGFVFERSGPPSALTSPHTAGILQTPRDADGKVIGYAMSKDTPRLDALIPSPLTPVPETSGPVSADAAVAEDTTSGLGIQGLQEVDKISDVDETESEFTENHTVPPFVERRNKVSDDDLYYNDGMIGLEGEFEQEFEVGGDSNFDESIFDNNDTDQFGRPIPGAFARAREAQTATAPDHAKRESDLTSRLSAQSGVSGSTAHTSLSVGPQHPVSAANSKVNSEEISPQRDVTVPLPPIQTMEQDKMAAYQAALAAAAHQAAASGKFRRDSSPPASPTEPKTPERPLALDEADLYESPSNVDFDDYEKDDMEDFDLDDDAIIAEANASALANDSDGWYGQEFGFYSAPTHGASTTTPNYEYSNGGYFGPSGVSRTKSGRAISREPNLTPITERSEYSNRNSIMSLVPPPIGSGASSLHSPGLAQLAMMADGGAADDMTLSALLRLRSRAWGGSQASLVSSRDGSPRSERADGANSPWGVGPGGFLSVGGPRIQHERKNSAISALSRDSEPVSESGSPTLTVNVPVITSSPAQPLPPAQPATSSIPCDFGGGQPASTLNAPQNPDISNLASSARSPEPSSVNSIKGDRPSTPSKRPAMGHRHKGSADSISYVKEQDSGEMRWIMERRRMDESGEVEILEREVLEGGRI